MRHSASTKNLSIKQVLTWLQQAFNNREIAIGLWFNQADLWLVKRRLAGKQERGEVKKLRGKVKE